MERPEGLTHEAWDALAPREPPPPPRRVALFLVGAAAVVALCNLVLTRPGFWQMVEDSGAANYAEYHPVALQLPGNLSPPQWVDGETVLLGTSTIGLGLPTAQNEQVLGRPAWTAWASGLQPSEYLALAPIIVKAHPARTVIFLEARMAGVSEETPFSRKNREAYAGLFNPVWKYRGELDDFGWLDVPRTLPLVRLREPLRVLARGYLEGRIIDQKLPARPPWKEAELGFAREQAQQTLAAYRAAPSPDRYLEYLHAVGMLHQGITVFWATMRRVEVVEPAANLQFHALRDVTAYLRDRGIAVSWVLFPENPICAQLTGEDGAPLAPAHVRSAAKVLFAHLAAEEGVPYLDLLDLATPDEFVDYTHLAPPGKAKLAAAVRAFLEVQSGSESTAPGHASAQPGAARNP